MSLGFIENVVIDNETFSLYIKQKNPETWEGTAHFVNPATDELELLFDFTLTYRGVWDGRLKFKEAEYYSDELANFIKVWNYIQKKIERSYFYQKEE